MKSIKPGRGPSMMGAFGSAAVTLFGVVWTFLVVSAGAPVFFSMFGIIFVVMGIAMTVYNLKNATSKNRYSAFDITDGNEEPDPLNEMFSETQSGRVAEMAGKEAGDADFCPYCGAEVEGDYEYCPKCGKKLPE
jgi:hypothetical protein